MKRGTFFWGLFLLVLGGLFLLQASGKITLSQVWGSIGPLALILGGAVVLSNAFHTRYNLEAANSFSIPLKNARRLNLKFGTGMGKVLLSGGAPAETAVRGSAGVGMDVESTFNDEILEVEINAGPSVLPGLGPEGDTWQVELTDSLPVALDIDAGAVNMELDLRPLKVTSLKFDGGACQLTLHLPENAGHTRIKMEMGAASLQVNTPSQTALRLEYEGPNALDVDTTRFPLAADGAYCSPDFDTAANKVDLRLKGGATSVTVR